jgi:hypothetical protein
MFGKTDNVSNGEDDMQNQSKKDEERGNAKSVTGYSITEIHRYR